MKHLIIASFLLAQSAFGTLLINENFEGTGAPSNWSGGAGANFDYSAVPLSGLQSLRVDGSSTGTATYLSGSTLNNSEVWFKLLFKAEALPASFQYAIYFYDGSAAFLYELRVQADGTLLLHDVGGTFVVQTVDGLSAGTIYNIWGHYKSGTGSDSTMECSFDVAGNARPNSGNKWAGGTTSHAVGNAQYFQAVGTNGVAFVFDDVQVADADAFAGGGATPTPTPMGSNRFFLFPQ